MSEYRTESGLVVTDRRHVRADDPRGWPPNPNVDPPPPDGPGVGPNTSEGFGNQHVMYPAESEMPLTSAVRPPPVMPWSGWPVEWATPNWGAGVGLQTIMKRLSIVFGCIDLNASILSTMPPYRLHGQRVVDPVTWMRNPQPEVYSGWTECMKQVFASYWSGEAFIWCTSRYYGGDVRTFVMLDPEWVEIHMEGHVRRYWLGKREDGAPEITGDLLHLRYLSWPGKPHGIGPLEALALNLFGAEALEKYASDLAVRGGIPWAVLAAPGNLTSPQATDLRESYVAARARADGAPAVLSGGVTLTPLNLSPKDMALLELRQFDEARIATLLGVPPFLAGIPTGDSMTYRNVEHVYDYHWRAFLRPKAAAVMEAISNWALVSSESIELNRDEYIRPDMGTRALAYEKLFNLVDEDGERAITVAEIRAAERLIGRLDDDTDDDSLDPANNQGGRLIALPAAGE